MLKIKVSHKQKIAMIVDTYFIDKIHANLKKKIFDPYGFKNLII